MRAVPDVAPGIARDVVRGKLQARQLVFGDDEPRLTALRPRQGDEGRILGAGSAHGCQPLHQPRRVLLAETAALIDVDQRRAGAVRHAVNDLRPAVLVVAVAEYL